MKFWTTSHVPVQSHVSRWGSKYLDSVLGHNVHLAKTQAWPQLIDLIGIQDEKLDNRISSACH